MQLKSIDIFVKVVQAESFTGAAKALDIPNSTVSARISQLEESLGVTLLNRTTRRVSVTEAGQKFYEGCFQAMEVIELAKNEITQSNTESQGLLRVTSTVDLGQSVLPSLIRRFSTAFPKVELELILTNERLDLVSHNIDIAIRIGKLADSSLKLRKLAEAKVGAFASPEYIDKHGSPTHPKELSQHTIIGFKPVKNRKATFKKGKSTHSQKINSHIWCDDPHVVKALVMEGLGMGFLGGFHVSSEVKRGSLIPILPDWTADKVALSLVYVEKKFLPVRLRNFIDFAAEEFSAYEATHL
ncbi:LysR family transcriptional regulator [Pseudobacteriovorax antillogorgiicola]|uniref:Transcriptional regulator, LysR family n=1 Tax=Pseudobacteriovorax antillogorgiicola TaxID=1513793 RepID=A0A1Y6CC06_9BACT|nr:LysR family transcriptional regulator [Pseudobacteriovorax antillogorgiicola]TCS49345.1 LysR family transcriptional regulator [Pseudobacteriovorax antillogorgiicola]SMF47673.1 transcriptional regulator, LysR family [Pseudobacteriovorax antillogorgiicola]